MKICVVSEILMPVMHVSAWIQQENGPKQHPQTSERCEGRYTCQLVYPHGNNHTGETGMTLQGSLRGTLGLVWSIPKRWTDLELNNKCDEEHSVLC